MNDRQSVGLSTVISRLGEVGDEYATLAISDHAVVVVSAGTGRIFGPFFGGEDPIGWVSRAFGSEGGLGEFRRAADWNVGGERLWLSPELEYFVEDRRDFWNTYAVPPSVDPGSYHLTDVDGGLRLATRFTLRSARTRDCQDVEIMRTIASVAEPADGRPAVQAACYRQEIVVESAADGPPAAPWLVRQVQLDGRVRIAARPGAMARPIVGPLPEDARVAASKGFSFDLSEGHLMKAAFPAAAIIPAIGYSLTRPATTAAIVMIFDGNADGPYFEEPPDRPGDNGYSAFVFRDDGRFGGYGELEVVGRPRPSSRPGRKVSSLTVTTSVLMGSNHDVEAAAAMLLSSGSR